MKLVNYVLYIYYLYLWKSPVLHALFVICYFTNVFWYLHGKKRGKCFLIYEKYNHERKYTITSFETKKIP